MILKILFNFAERAVLQGSKKLSDKIGIGTAVQSVMGGCPNCGQFRV
jgi:hypothetical protein